MIAAILVLGAGYAGSHVARLARERGLRVTTTVRSEAREKALSSEGLTVRRFDELDEANVAPLVDSASHVVIAFPPDGRTDARIAPALRVAAAVTYISTTGVYESARGVVDDTTALPESPGPRSARVLEAESIYRQMGGTVLRAPGIYGPERGLHRRIQRGEHRLPGDGSGYLSRIHVEDLAQLVVASSAVHGETFVVGDAEPAPQAVIAKWVADAYGVAMPPSVPAESVHETLRGDRRVDGSRALRVLGVTLRYPSYREGMAPCST